MFYALVLLDGALRKWVLPGYASAVYVLKDVVLLGAFLLFSVSGEIRPPTVLRRGATAWILLAYAGWVAVETLNPHEPNAWVALLGLKSHTLYLLLVLMVPAALPADPGRVLRGLAVYIFAAAIPISLLGVVQFFEPPSSWLNRYAADTTVDLISTFGTSGRPRVTGTFAYITGMTTFVVFNLGLALGLLLAGIRAGGRLVYLGWLLLAASLCVAPMTGSRAVLYLPAVAVIPILFAAMRTGVINRRLLIAGSLCALGLLIGSRGEAASAWGDLRQRIETSGDGAQRANDALVGPLSKLDQAGVFGYGAGTTHQAAPSLAPDLVAYSWLPTSTFEEEMGRVALEVGLVGLLFYLTLKLVACVMAYRLLWAARGGLDLAIGAGAFTFFVVHVAAGIVFNTAASAAYWGLFGWVAVLLSGQVAERRRVPGQMRVAPPGRHRARLSQPTPQPDATAG